MKQTVLIADGDDELCAAYQRFLSSCGYLAQTSTDGVDCLEKLRRVMPAVIVLDPDLRWGGGDGVLAWLREEDSTHTVPVIVTPTAGCAWENARFTLPPVAECLPKPFALTALLDSVRSAIARGQLANTAQALPMRWRRFPSVILKDRAVCVDPSRAEGEPLAQAIRRHIEANTWGRIRELKVELTGDRVIVRGYSPSYYLIPRALLAVREVLPSKPVTLNIEMARGTPHGWERHIDSASARRCGDGIRLAKTSTAPEEFPSRRPHVPVADE
jgi:DNA-binding response OmpR family regulator